MRQGFALLLCSAPRIRFGFRETVEVRVGKKHRYKKNKVADKRQDKKR
jgi:hypothetical protein